MRVIVRDADARKAGRSLRDRRHSAHYPAHSCYISGTTGLAKGILHAHRFLLGHEEFVYRHEVRKGELFHGMGERAWAAGSALFGRGATAPSVRRCREGASIPHEQLRVLSKDGVTNVFTTPTAMRSMMSIEDAAERYPQSSAGVARR